VYSPTLSSSHSVLVHVRKNWHPLLLGPLLAMDSSPAPVCFPTKFSSANLVPYMHVHPVPSPFRKSPPWIMKSGGGRGGRVRESGGE
jgi:hypothetical protein